MSLADLTAERDSPAWTRLALLAFAAFLVLPHLLHSPLTVSEGIMAGTARGFLESGDFTRLRHLGRPIHQYPLYPWLLAVFGLEQGPDWLIRVPAVAGWLAMAALAWFTAAKSGGEFAGLIAALVPLTCAAGYAAASVASNDIWFATILFAAWTAWYRLGAVQGRWDVAWGVSAGFVALAFFAGGPRAFVLFYLPLLVLRWPVKGREQMLRWGHLLALVLVVALSGTWLAHSLRHAEVLTWAQLVESAVPADQGGYVQRLWQFPLRVVAWGLPWTLFAWPAFCQAFRPVEKAPEQSAFLRTVATAVFVPCWLLPGVTVRSLLVLLGPLAVLTAMNYESLLRRHAAGYRRLLNLCTRAACGAAAIGVLAAVLLLTGWLEIPELSFAEVSFAGACVLLSVGFAVLLISSRGRAVWVRLLLTVAVATVVFRTFSLPFEALRSGRPRLAAHRLTEPLPDGYPLYVAADLSLAAIGHYITHPVVRLASPAQLPQSTPRVYLLAAGEPPVQEDLRWRALGRPAAIGGGPPEVRILWMPASGAILRVDITRPETQAEAELAGADWVQLYEGTPRTLTTQP